MQRKKKTAKECKNNYQCFRKKDIYILVYKATTKTLLIQVTYTLNFRQTLNCTGIKKFLNPIKNFLDLDQLPTCVINGSLKISNI